MKHNLFFYCACLLWTVLLAACQYSSPDYTVWDLSPEARDSLRFVERHQYSVNYNFVVIADSLSVCPDSLERHALLGKDSVRVLRQGDLVVVADYLIQPQDSVDSVWIKVAHDQHLGGWLHERELLEAVVPDEPISQFIHFFSDFHPLLSLLLVVLVALSYLYRVSRRKPLPMVHFRDIDSPYPTLLCLAVAGAAVFYGSIQHFVPVTWVHYYYYPTLNPFVLPLGMACFVGCVWAVILLILACVDEVFRRLSVSQSVLYLLGLACICLLNYFLFSVTTPWYVGYAFFVAYVWFAVSRYLRQRHYRCGNCGANLPKGVMRCPHCGVQNV